MDNSSITVQNETLILFYTSTSPQMFFILADASYLFAQAILHRFPMFLISLPHLSPKLSSPTQQAEAQRFSLKVYSSNKSLLQTGYS